MLWYMLVAHMQDMVVAHMKDRLVSFGGYGDPYEVAVMRLVMDMILIL